MKSAPGVCYLVVVERLTRSSSSSVPEKDSKSPGSPRSESSLARGMRGSSTSSSSCAWWSPSSSPSPHLRLLAAGPPALPRAAPPLPLPYPPQVVRPIMLLWGRTSYRQAWTKVLTGAGHGPHEGGGGGGGGRTVCLCYCLLVWGQGRGQGRREDIISTGHFLA